MVKKSLGEGGPFARLETLETRVATMNPEIVGLLRRVVELEQKIVELETAALHTITALDAHTALIEDGGRRLVELERRARLTTEADGPMTIEAG